MTPYTTPRYPDTRIRPANEAVREARNRLSGAEAALRRAIDDKAAGDRRIAELKSRGIFDPFLVERDSTLAELSANGSALVYRHGTIERIDRLREIVTQRQADLEEALKVLAEIRTRPEPRSESDEIEAATNAGAKYVTTRPMVLAGQSLDIAEPVPPGMLDGITWQRLNLWTRGNQPMLREVH